MTIRVRIWSQISSSGYYKTFMVSKYSKPKICGMKWRVRPVVWPSPRLFGFSRTFIKAASHDEDLDPFQVASPICWRELLRAHCAPTACLCPRLKYPYGTYNRDPTPKTSPGDLSNIERLQTPIPPTNKDSMFRNLVDRPGMFQGDKLAILRLKAVQSSLISRSSRQNTMLS